jgi:hypothetical protein
MMLRPIALSLALAASSLAWGEARDPPERLARLAYVEGEATFQAANERATDTLPDRPLHPGDRITTDSGARAELALGTATIRLDERSELAISDLNEATVRIELLTGTASVYLDELLENENFAVVTPNTTITLVEPGEYRVDVHTDDVSVLSLHGGVAEIATAGGPVRVASGQRVRIEGRDAIARLETPRPADAFDDWVLGREVKLAETEPPRYTPYAGDEYAELDRYGEWYDEPRYGRVWMPGYSYASWSPYGSGYWQRVGFGWTWVDSAPWGFSSYYGGRWTYLPDRDRWCWVPRSRDREVPESAPRIAGGRDAVGEIPRVATPGVTPRRIESDRRPTGARENPADERPWGGTITPPANREPRPAAPTAAPPRDGGTTIQPSRAERARSEPPSERSPSRREDGARPEP